MKTSTLLVVLVLAAFALTGCSDDTSSSEGPNATNTSNNTNATNAMNATNGGTNPDAGPDASTAAAEIVMQFGEDLSPTIQARIEAHVSAVGPERPVRVVAADETLSDLHADTLVLAFGDTTTTRALISDAEVDALGDEGYVLRSGALGEASVIAADGRGEDDGTAYGAYALLESLGFAFLHPLAPTMAAEIPMDAPAIDRTTSPRWPIRGWQVHTMHPLEITNLLQGWGPDSPDDRAGWEAMLPEWDSFLEWLVANGQNRAHWVWLIADDWAEFGDSQERIDRMKILVDHAHAFGIEVGMDVPIALHQQHAWRLIRTQGTLESETAQIEDRVNYLMKAGFDYLATESGTSEFTSVEDTRMVAWMDALAATMADDHGKEVFIKVHASQGQTVENYTDPDTGQPLNFNFLPHYADSRMGVLPHTVQHYALDDHAPTYANTDFGYMREFLQEEVGRRLTVWHPETAYWVSFDIDVPLFLPIYAHTRVKDLRILARDEEAGLMGRGEHAGKMMDGQMIFSSGWEWGYWLQEVASARAAWDPMMEIEDDRQATAAHMRPVTRLFGDAADEVETLLLDTIDAEQDLLIDGIIDGRFPPEVERLNGQAYLQGHETWDDIADLAADWLGIEHSRTQPDKIGLVEMRGILFDSGEWDDLSPLLDAMDKTFPALAARWTALRAEVPVHALPLYDDLAAAAQMTGLRAIQVASLYRYVHAQENNLGESVATMHLTRAQDALDQAVALVARREPHYRVPLDRIASWKKGPTAYEYGYLWTVHSLHFWWRDEGKAFLRPNSPCYMNTINPIDVGFGEGDWAKAGDVAADVFDEVAGLGDITECLGAPMTEPTYPPEGLRE